MDIEVRSNMYITVALMLTNEQNQIHSKKIGTVRMEQGQMMQSVKNHYMGLVLTIMHEVCENIKIK